MTTDTSERPRRRHRGWRIFGWIGGAILAIVLVVSIIGSITPWPSAMLIRAVFTQGGEDAAAEMKRHVPDTPIGATLGIQYGGADDPDTTMDVFTNAGAGDVLPTIVWVHGGAWIAGSSDNVDPYMQILASEGYTAVALNYSLGPEQVYPTAVNQLNTALHYIDENAAELGIDNSQIVLAGDSAGAQLASQLAAIITNDRYAALLDVTPALQPEQVVGIILNCGVYDMPAMAELDGIVAWGLQTALWAYTGTKGWSASYQGSTMSTIDFVTADFPTTYISGGNGDGLTWLQSIPMSGALRDAGVDVTELFWPAQHEPSLPHEYQFHLDMPDAQTALMATLDWLETVTTK